MNYLFSKYFKTACKYFSLKSFTSWVKLFYSWKWDRFRAHDEEIYGWKQYHKATSKSKATRNVDRHWLVTICDANILASWHHFEFSTRLLRQAEHKISILKWELLGMLWEEDALMISLGCNLNNYNWRGLKEIWKVPNVCKNSLNNSMI
mgnify:CR=1 FL=1